MINAVVYGNEKSNYHNDDTYIDLDDHFIEDLRRPLFPSGYTAK